MAMASSKNALQELVVRYPGIPPPVYDCDAGSGPQHGLIFTATCTVAAYVYEGHGPSKRAAELEAAARALDDLRTHPEKLRRLPFPSSSSSQSLSPSSASMSGLSLSSRGAGYQLPSIPVKCVSRPTLVFVDVESSQDVDAFTTVCFRNVMVFASSSSSTNATMRDKLRAWHAAHPYATAIRELYSDSSMPDAADLRIVFEVGRMAGLAMGGVVVLVSNDNFAACLKTVLAGSGVGFDVVVLKRCSDCVEYLNSQLS